MAKPRTEAMLRPGIETLAIAGNWLTLGDLRGLVAHADRLGWHDESLVDQGPGGEHPERHDIFPCNRIMIERMRDDG